MFGRLTLDPFLPPGGTTVTLTSSNPAVASVPASVLVDRPCCLDYTAALGSFPIDPKQVTVPDDGHDHRHVADGLGVGAAHRRSRGGEAVDVGGTAGTVVLGGAAPPGGATVTFTSSNPALIPAPAPVTIAAGGSSGAFTIAPEAGHDRHDGDAHGDVAVELGVDRRRRCIPPPSLLTPAAGASLRAGARRSGSTGPTKGPGRRDPGLDVTGVREPRCSTGSSTATSEITTSSLPAGTLYWRVRAYDDSFDARSVVGVSHADGDGFDRPAAAPSLLAPANDARVNEGQSVTFRWSSVTGAASYVLQVDDSSSFSAPLVLNRSVTRHAVDGTSSAKAKLWWRGPRG